MRRFISILLCGGLLPPLLLLSAAAPARAENAALVNTYTRWLALRDPDSGPIAFADGVDFLSRTPGWPDQKIIRIRTEAAALATAPDKAAMQNFCTAFPPITGRGMLACANANAGDTATRERWVHQGWRQGDFSADEEAAIRSRYASVLSKADFAARYERLVMENKPAAARRLYGQLPAGAQAVAEAAFALHADARGAERNLKKLSAAQLREPILLFARIQWRIRHHQEDQIAPLLASAPADVPVPDAWWPARALAAREALHQHQPAQALTILTNHGDLKPELLSEALWLKGWVTLRARRDAGEAYKEFYHLYTAVATPVSKARAAYWAARAAIENGNTDIARQWMEKAARHPTVFYGQLAAQFLQNDAPLHLPDVPRISASEKNAFDAEMLVAITRQLARQGETSLRDVFLAHLGAQADSPARYALVAQLAAEVNGQAARVRVAKQALRDGVVLINDGWPVLKVPANGGIEPALTLAITRQESEFDPLARSSADARGLMQLLPATARHVADHHLLPYGADTLDNPSENMTLGSLYLGQIIDGFNGSYILGIASYNAGPATVRGWLAAQGAPPKTVAGAVDWIESIPYAETRNYVMRVLENVQVYRARIDADTPLALTRDLTR